MTSSRAGPAFTNTSNNAMKGKHKGTIVNISPHAGGITEYFGTGGGAN